MAGVNRYINWTSVAFTPAGGASTPINGVTACSFDEHGSPELFYGDGDQFCTTLAVPQQSRTAEVDAGDAAALDAVAIGTVGVLVATLNDAKNKAGAAGGGKLYTLSNAVLLGKPRSGSHGKYAGGKYKFEAYSADGTTDPLAITPV